MSFIKSLFKSKTKNVNLTICGLDQAGKTTIVRYLISGEHRDTVPTMGINREVIKLPKLQMNVYDLGGQKEFRAIWSDVNENSDALIYVVDSADRERFEETKEVFYNVLQTQIQNNIPVLLILNKCDLPDRINRIDFVRQFGLTGEISFKWACFETSALNGEGIIEAFTWLVDEFGGE